MAQDQNALRNKNPVRQQYVTENHKKIKIFASNDEKYQFLSVLNDLQKKPLIQLLARSTKNGLSLDICTW